MLLRFSAEFETRLSQWQQAQLLRPLDVALLRALPQAATLPEPVLLYLMLASAQLAQGHLCLDFNQAARDPFLMLPAALRQRPQARWLEQFCLQHPPAEIPGRLSAYPALIAAGPERQHQPFVLQGNRLYLRRYAEDERSIAAFITSRSQADQQLRQQLDPQELRQLLSLLFPRSLQEQQDPAPDWQQQACALAASSYFAVITGGPGTGKTTTVLKLLLLLLRQSSSGLHILLAAPTGKAAARLTESLTNSRLQLARSLPQLADVLPHLPVRAQTVHRLLAPKPDGNGFRFNAAQLLPADVVIVDEASMLDVSLFAALVRALPPQCRLILLGDKDQLASVEAGAVLAEICRHADAGGYSQATADWLATLTGQTLPPQFLSAAADPLDQQVMMLRKSHRFDAQSGIGQLARAVNRGDPAAAALFHAAAGQADATGVADLQAVLLPQEQLAQHVSQRLIELLAPYLQLLRQPVTPATMTAQALALHQQFAKVQLLCALRQGPAGVETVNQALELRLAQLRLIQKNSGWYHGRPVIVLQNDYSTGLMNGDIGICLAVEEAGNLQLRVAFLQPDFSAAAGTNPNTVRWFLPGRLPQLETAFALTVHKSQGSEFAHALLLLPPTESPVLTCELVYTAITRAREQFSLLLTDWQVFEQAVSRRIQRQGGLRLG